jgi:hypothetical protein
MVCPLRYGVAAVSLLVAIIVLLWHSEENGKVSSSSNNNMDNDKILKKKWRWIDFFTGRFLYDRWQELNMRPSEITSPR